MNAFEKKAMHYLPKGYTVEYRKSPGGRHYGKQTLIQPLGQPQPRASISSCTNVPTHTCTTAPLECPAMSRKWKLSFGLTPKWKRTTFRSPQK
jgi:hypothetical protein